MSELGPITAALEEEVKRELRQRGIVVWLDKDAQYNGYVDALRERHDAGGFFAPVVAHRGSYLDMVLGLARYGNGLDPEPVLIHMPGHNEESVRKTPVLETYRAGYRFRKSLDTLVREAAAGRVGPAEIDRFLSTNPNTVEEAETWLRSQTDKAVSGFAGHLESLTLEWVLDGLVGKDKVLVEKAKEPEALNALVEHLYRHTGMDEAFLAFIAGTSEVQRDAKRVAEAFGGWLMCVEYVQDLTREPQLDELKPLRKLSKPLVATCRKLIDCWRDHHPDEYAAHANLVESNRLQAELSAMGPDDLGKIDTFRREESVILMGAVKALLAEDWERASRWAEARHNEQSFWLARDPARRMAWTLVRDAARLGQAIAEAPAPLNGVSSIDDAVAYYTSKGYEVDRAHRRFEQQRMKLLESKLPHFGSLLKVVGLLRQKHRAWADELTARFNKICGSQGFIPGEALQQRTLYEQVVHPSISGKNRVAYFLIDAFRYEMATELLSEFESAGTTVHLDSRLAELPTITSVGMNALAPVSKSGRLALASGAGFKGFKTGEFTVRTPDERVRAMAERSIDASDDRKKSVQLVPLADVCNLPVDKLKRSCGKARLIVVHSKEIDDAGEANVGLPTFETWLQQIKSAWHRLFGIGVTHFVFTADHGFLLQDDTTTQRPFGSKKDPSRRHVLSAEPRKEDGIVTVSLAELGYDGQEGHLLFSNDTAVFSTGKAGATFVHGGNSMQERLIPVLRVAHRTGPTLGMAEYMVDAEALDPILGLNRLRLRIKPEAKPMSTLTFMGAKAVSVALRVPERPEVRPTVKEATKTTVQNQQFQVPVTDEWTEVIFELRGPADERCKVEVFHPDAVEQVESLVLDAYFSVLGAGGTGEATSSAPAAPELGWEQGLADEAVRAVFVHLHEHGSITEVELNGKLGTPRAVRRFARDFEQYVRKVPFAVRIETGPNGKRYVKES